VARWWFESGLVGALCWLGGGPTMARNWLCGSPWWLGGNPTMVRQLENEKFKLEKLFTKFKN
jgi:hypothetical protein